MSAGAGDDVTQPTDLVGTEATFKMERAIACLALELPAEVWEDVRDTWHAAKDSLAADILALEARVQKLRDALSVIAVETSIHDAQKKARTVLDDD